MWDQVNLVYFLFIKRFFSKPSGYIFVFIQLKRYICKFGVKSFGVPNKIRTKYVHVDIRIEVLTSAVKCIKVLTSCNFSVEIKQRFKREKDRFN